MRTLILYGSKYGYTKECAHLLRDELGETDIVDLGRPHSVSLDAYDTVLIGSPVYQVPPSVKTRICELSE